jgi:hypothetical protein
LEKKKAIRASEGLEGETEYKEIYNIRNSIEHRVLDEVQEISMTELIHHS